MPYIYDAIIVGAGLAGLACARKLQDANQTVLIIDKSDRVGGRLRTDVVDDFRLDHGFQVLNTAYVNAQDCLDFNALQLGTFLPGARVFIRNQFHDLLDPLRIPSQGFKTLLSTIGNMSDKLRVLLLRRYCAKHVGRSDESRTTLEFLNDFGFSESFIQTFFRPFYTGIFLEQRLDTSAAVFIYTFDRFSRGLASIPAAGMGAIPAQLATQLTQCDLKLNTEILSIRDNTVHTKGPDSFTARAIILATPFDITDRLLERKSTRQWKETQCMYFAAPKAPMNEPVLLLNGNENESINLVCVPSNVAPDLAPQGQNLVCVSLSENLEAHSVSEILNELHHWFGAEVRQWRHLKTYRIPYALPSATPDELSLNTLSHTERGYFICGDHCTLPTIDHALGSGIAAANAVLKSI